MGVIEAFLPVDERQDLLVLYLQPNAEQMF
jgi:hypothetical protein